MRNSFSEARKARLISKVRVSSEHFQNLRFQTRILSEIAHPRSRLRNTNFPVWTTLHNDAGFRWADVAGILGVSERTLRRRRHQFGLTVGRGDDFTDISNNDLDNHVSEILRTTPSSGQRLVEGGLRNRGLRIQRRRIQESMRRVDPVISTLRSARNIIRRVYNVPSPNALW